ncbi:hypothetical protein O181_097984 [Austropuccinia psidii MF-1]|uniref:Uncharacterized protein n=1 Tax=Austropuccinia psidii MF-1 TaxID=1389203 RepID=A0A9Q3J9X4_9BASI|nr:hypothetical protein [Austropuccinia psidii MF-1]
MLTRPHSPLGVTPKLPPITPYASTPAPLTIHTLPWNPQDIPPTPPSTLLMPPHARLILFTNYHPYALSVSSQHAFNAAPHLHPHHSLRGALKIYLLRCLLFADYHPYALSVSSKHASNASHHLHPHHSLRFHTPATHHTYTPCPPNIPPTLPPISALITPYASTPPPLLRRPQPSLCLHPPTLSSLPITILMLLQCPPNMPPMLLPHQPNPQRHLPSLHSQNETTIPLHLRPHHSLHFHTPAAYNPYPPAVPSRYASDASLNPPYA